MSLLPVKHLFLSLLPAILLEMAVTVCSADSFSAEQIEFFESKVRPVLVEHCVDCHGAKKQNNDLRLDSRTAILKGSGYGPVVTPGNPDASKLIIAVAHAKPAEVMPMPKGGSKLGDAEIANLKEWVRQGLPWPAEVTGAAPLEKNPRDHWAFQKVQMPPVPSVMAKDRVQQPVDAFVIAGLEKAALGLSPQADRATLLKRWTMDLLGLPATYEEIQTFLADPASDAEAAAKQVDRLLASSHFGERLGRHWLDVARYADTKGYVFQEERRYAYAYTYRDWVIRAFNADMPYDEFLRQQLSADRREGAEQKQNQAALGFLTVGRRFLNNNQDIIDDRLDVVFRGTQGLTVTCARCHDHKFDPIPTADYYSLYGVFNSSFEPKDLPELEAEANTPDGLDFKDKVAAQEKILEEYRAGRLAASRTPEYFAKAVKAVLLSAANGVKWSQVARDENVYRVVAEKLQDWVKSPELGGPWLVELFKKPEAEWPALAAAAENGPAAWLVVELKKHLPKNKDELQVALGRLLAEAMTPEGRAELKTLRDWLHRPANLAHFVPGDLVASYFRDERDRENEVTKAIAKIKATHPGSPPKAMVMHDADKPNEPVVFIRGNAGRHGPRVPRQFLNILSSPESRKPFTDGSGRRELADAIASKENPLTARVFVNRLWGWYFGQPLIDTPSDFGVRTALAKNPVLLEYLAARFMEQNWSTKKLLRELLLSSAYGQSSKHRPAAAAVDPENALLWRMNRKRLGWEALRDSLLAMSTGLDRTQFGRAVPMFEEKLSNRRTIYGFIDRQNLSNQLRTFDFASPDSHAPKRFETSVPQQALFMLNSPFVMDRAQELVKATQHPKLDEQLKKLFQASLGRDASSQEMQAALAFATAQPVEPDAPDGKWQLGYGFWDAPANRTNFTRMTAKAKLGWAPGADLPHPTFSYLHIRGGSGHPGLNDQQAAIARWEAGQAATLDVKSLFRHATPQGDGVRVQIVSNKNGILLESQVPPGQSKELRVPARSVEAGEIWDFIVYPGSTSNHDTYEWDPTIREMPTKRVVNHPGNAKQQRKEGISALTALAQSLLCANEVVFVD
jgi:hypothetical protein